MDPPSSDDLDTATTEEASWEEESAMMDGDVTSAESPHRFFCRTDGDKQRFFDFKDSLKTYYYRYGSSLCLLDVQKKKKKAEEECVVVWHEGSFWRAKASDRFGDAEGDDEVREEESPSGSTGRFHLLDDGRTVSVDRRSTYLMASEFSPSVISPFVFRCHLSDVVASVDLPNEWSDDARAFFAMEARGCPGVVIQRRGRPELMPDGCESLPVEIHFRETVAECFTLAMPVLVTMSSKLLKKKLAVTRMEATNLAEEGEYNQEEEEPDDNLATVADKEAELVARWPPPVIPTASTFMARVTSISTLGQIYVQLKEDIPVVRAMRSQLNEFNMAELQGDPEEVAWKENDECIALYSGKWYRARVVEAASCERTVAVIYVDFGTFSRIPRSHLRPARELGHHRMYAIRVVLHGIEARNPEGRWTMRDLDDIFEFLFYGKRRAVRITRMKQAKTLPIECKLEYKGEDGDFHDFAEHLLEERVATVRKLDYDPLRCEYLKDAFGIQGIPSGKVVPPSNGCVLPPTLKSPVASEDPVRSPFREEVVRLRRGSLIPVHVQVVTETGKVYFHLLEEGDSGHSKAFVEFSKKLDEEADLQPPAPMEEGAAVAVRYRNGIWYRAFIVSAASERPLVLFVDVSGVWEEVDSRRLKILPERFVDSPPVFAVAARLNYSGLTEQSGRGGRTRIDLINAELARNRAVFFKVEADTTEGRELAGSLHIRDADGDVRHIFQKRSGH